MGGSARGAARVCISNEIETSGPRNRKQILRDSSTAVSPSWKRNDRATSRVATGVGAVKNRKNPDRVPPRNSFCSFSLVMGSSGGDFTAIETAMLKCETVEGLKRAIDNSSRR